MFKKLDRFGPRMVSQAAPKGPDPLETALSKIKELQTYVGQLEDERHAREQDIVLLNEKIEKSKPKKKTAAKKKIDVNKDEAK